MQLYKRILLYTDEYLGNLMDCKVHKRTLVTTFSGELHAYKLKKFPTGSGIEITDFQTPNKMSDTIKYAPDILKIHQKSYIMVTSDVHKYSFCEITPIA